MEPNCSRAQRQLLPLYSCVLLLVVVTNEGGDGVRWRIQLGKNGAVKTFSGIKRQVKEMFPTFAGCMLLFPTVAPQNNGF